MASAATASQAWRYLRRVALRGRLDVQVNEKLREILAIAMR